MYVYVITDFLIFFLHCRGMCWSSMNPLSQADVFLASGVGFALQAASMEADRVPGERGVGGAALGGGLLDGRDGFWRGLPVPG